MPSPFPGMDPYVVLDLQAAVNACLDLVGYERLLDYGASLPAPALDEADSAWIARCLQTAGLA